MIVVVVAAVVAWLAWHVLGLGLVPTAVVVVGAVMAWSAFAAVFWPFVPCPMPFCEKGKVRRPGKGKRRSYRRCGWCKGKGERVRWFRRFYDEVRPSKHRRR